MELCLQKNTKKVGTPGLFQCTPKAEKSKGPEVTVQAHLTREVFFARFSRKTRVERRKSRAKRRQRLTLLECAFRDVTCTRPSRGRVQ